MAGLGFSRRGPAYMKPDNPSRGTTLPFDPANSSRGVPLKKKRGMGMGFDEDDRSGYQTGEYRGGARMERGPYEEGDATYQNAAAGSVPSEDGRTSSSPWEPNRTRQANNYDRDARSGGYQAPDDGESDMPDYRSPRYYEEDYDESDYNEFADEQSAGRARAKRYLWSLWDSAMGDAAQEEASEKWRKWMKSQGYSDADIDGIYNETEQSGGRGIFGDD